MADSASAFIDSRLGVREVEPGRRPPLYVMTGLALRAEGSGVEGRVLVACDTSRGKILEGSIGMALVAFDIGMSAGQGEIRAAVVEIRIFPIGWVVAGFAVCAVFAVMDIVLSVAGVTILRRGLQAGYRDGVKMAFRTSGVNMPAFEFERVGIMVEVAETVYAVMTGHAIGTE